MNTPCLIHSQKPLSVFRFLYGRWILRWSMFVTRYSSVQIPLWSMNTLFLFNLSKCRIEVQIPLWSMNTIRNGDTCKLFIEFRFLYGRWIQERASEEQIRAWVQIPLWSMNTVKLPPYWRYLCLVQIPLWSMNTGRFLWCYHRLSLFRFLYGRWIPAWLEVVSVVCQVQIPLWSMNTGFTTMSPAVLPEFRFLYGRWIHGNLDVTGHKDVSSDSSMVDEYIMPWCFTIRPVVFRFLYGRWIPFS